MSKAQRWAMALQSGGILIVLILGLLQSSALAQDNFGPPGVVHLACIDGKSILLNEDGFPIVLDQDELERRAIHRAAIETEKGSATAESIDLYIAIDDEGRVLCASLTEQSRKGIRRFEANAIETAKKWVFQPVLKNGQPIFCMGYLELRVVDRATIRGRVRQE